VHLKDGVLVTDNKVFFVAGCECNLKQMKMRSGEKALGLGDAIPEDIKDN